MTSKKPFSSSFRHPFLQVPFNPIAKTLTAGSPAKPKASSPVQTDMFASEAPSVAKALSIIGTAGRKDDAAKIDRALYDAMYDRVSRIIDAEAPALLVSGGAAVSDHLVVRAFLDGICPKLRLHLPAPWSGVCFQETTGGQWDPAGTANYYHKKFSSRCGLDSLDEIQKAIEMGAEIIVTPGFKKRNLLVAKDSTIMIALTFGSSTDVMAEFASGSPGFLSHEAAGLKDGGTAHTWSSCRDASKKYHVDLTVLRQEIKRMNQPGRKF